MGVLAVLAAMHTTEPGEDYQASIGQLLTMMSTGRERSPQRSDPLKVAQVILNMITCHFFSLQHLLIATARRQM